MAVAMTPKNKQQKEKTDKMYFIEIKIFLFSRYHQKEQITHGRGEKYVQIISLMRVLSNIYKELVSSKKKRQIT